MLRIYNHTIVKRLYSTGRADLKSTLRNVIPERLKLYNHVKKDLANHQIGSQTVGAVIGGMRGTQALLWDSSSVDPNKGVTFHGLTIEECQTALPKSKHELRDSASEMLPESMFWFLLTGRLPTQAQINDLSLELAQKGELPGYVVSALDNLPKSLHPMTQLSIGISLMNNESVFAKAYARGIPKTDAWEYVLDDVMNLIAKLPALVGKIYSNTYYNGKELGAINMDKDWSYNMASTMGFTNDDSVNVKDLSKPQSRDFVNLIRLYCALHGDHEGGNVSAHATHLVGSSLSDPFLSYSAGIQGLAGPLHGLAAQEVVRFILEMKKAIGGDINNKNEIEKHLWNLLNSKRVIPGYGHGVLRKPDPRFIAMMKFGDNRSDEFAKDSNFQLVKNLSQIAPSVLTKHGKTRNPYPNVDSSSGILFYHYGLQETLFLTVIFGASRALGPLSQLVWDRVYGLPIERPTSVTLTQLAGF